MDYELIWALSRSNKNQYPYPHQTKIRIRIRIQIKVISRIRIRPCKVMHIGSWPLELSAKRILNSESPYFWRNYHLNPLCQTFTDPDPGSMQGKRLTPGSGEESGSLLRALDCPRMLRQPVPSLPCTTSIDFHFSSLVQTLEILRIMRMPASIRKHTELENRNQDLILYGTSEKL